MDAATCRSRYLAASVLLLLVVVLAIMPVPLFAQRDLTVLHDSLQRIDDPSVLRGMMARRFGKDADRSPEVLTERGFIGLRLFELTASRDDGKFAQKSFEAAIRRAPDYGWAHYGLGLVLTGGPDANPWSGGLRNSFVLDDAIARVFGNAAPFSMR
jgi:hypothetical protein